MGTKNTPPETPVELPAAPSLIEVRQLAQELEIQKDRARNLNNQHEQAIEDLIIARGLFAESIDLAKAQSVDLKSIAAQVAGLVDQANAAVRSVNTALAQLEALLGHPAERSDINDLVKKLLSGIRSDFDAQSAEISMQAKSHDAALQTITDDAQARVDRAIAQVTLVAAGGIK
jgi:hypothetical protein